MDKRKFKSCDIFQSILNLAKEAYRGIYSKIRAWSETQQQKDIADLLAELEDPTIAESESVYLVADENRDRLIEQGLFRLYSAESITWQRQGEKILVIIVYSHHGVTSNYVVELKIDDDKKISFVEMKEYVRSSFQNTDRSVTGYGLKRDILELIVEAVEEWRKV